MCVVVGLINTNSCQDNIDALAQLRGAGQSILGALCHDGGRLRLSHLIHEHFENCSVEAGRLDSFPSKRGRRPNSELTLLHVGMDAECLRSLAISVV